MLEEAPPGFLSFLLGPSHRERREKQTPGDCAPQRRVTRSGGFLSALLSFPSHWPSYATSRTPSGSPTLTFLEMTGRGSVSCSGLMRIETADDAVISLRRLLMPCVDSFSKDVTFCVDSFKRSETVGANLLCPFKSLLSMLIAKSMEFRPAKKRGGGGRRLQCLLSCSHTSNISKETV